jgi:hypothetical protein
MALWLYRNGQPSFYIDRGVIYDLAAHPRAFISGLAAYDAAGAQVFTIEDRYFHDGGAEPPFYFSADEVTDDMIADAAAAEPDGVFAAHLMKVQGSAFTTLRDSVFPEYAGDADVAPIEAVLADIRQMGFIAMIKSTTPRRWVNIPMSSHEGGVAACLERYSLSNLAI